jgi:hypothetical protein
MIRRAQGAETDQFTICTKVCGARCCRYITVPIATPRGHEDWDEMRWWLEHEGVSVSKDEDGWQLIVATQCRNLRADNACAIYEHRMDTCEEYDPAACEFPGPIEIEFELKGVLDLADYLERRRLVRGAKVARAIRAAEDVRPRGSRASLLQLQGLPARRGGPRGDA